jgi:hypothetical protein
VTFHYYNLAVTIIHLLTAGILIYYFDEKNILPIISLFIGIVYLSQNQPLQYENKPQIRVVTVVAIVAAVSFFLLNWYLIDHLEYAMTKVAGYVLTVVNVLYFLKGSLYKPKYSRVVKTHLQGGRIKPRLKG